MSELQETESEGMHYLLQSFSDGMTNSNQCDEQRPVCGGCKLRGRDCLYLTIPHSQSPKSPPSTREKSLFVARNSSTFNNSSTSPPARSSPVSSRTSPRSADSLFSDLILNNDDLTNFPESKERRLLEIRLMVHGVQKMLVTPSLTDRWLAYWLETIPKLATQYDVVLYASCACSAGNLLQHPDGDGDSEVLQTAHRNYMVMALREQRRLCNFINETNAEAICLSAALLGQATFLLMQDLSQDAFEAAIEWMKVGKGVEKLHWKISAAVSPNLPNAFKIFHKTYQLVREQWREETSFDEPFASVWGFICGKEHNPDNREIYRRTLTYISWIQRYNDGGEPSVIVERRLQTFGIQIPAEFINFAEARNPLALVVLAHFFGVMAQVEGHYWWLQPLKGARVTLTYRLIHAIKNLLDESYHPIISWPLRKATLPR